MRAAKRWVMRECMLKGYNQVNLLACSAGNDYWVEKRGKEAEPDFKTDKDMIQGKVGCVDTTCRIFGTYDILSGACGRLADS